MGRLSWRPPFRVPSFAVTVGGVLFRAAISAAPFLLPLMFQLAFGLNPLDSGLLLLAVFAGNLGMKPATSIVLGKVGFRRTLISNGALAIAETGRHDGRRWRLHPAGVAISTTEIGTEGAMSAAILPGRAGAIRVTSERARGILLGADR